jgi:thiol:disulfide interchange protein
MSAPQDRSVPTSNEWCTHKTQSSGQELQPTTAYQDDEHATKPVEASFEGCAGAGEKGPPSPRRGTEIKPIQDNNTNTNVQQATSVTAQNVKLATSMLTSESAGNGPTQEGSGWKRSMWSMCGGLVVGVRIVCDAVGLVAFAWCAVLYRMRCNAMRWER